MRAQPTGTVQRQVEITPRLTDSVLTGNASNGANVDTQETVQEITGGLEIPALMMTDGGTKETHEGPPCAAHRMIDTGGNTKTGDGIILTIEMTVEIEGTTAEATRENSDRWRERWRR